VATRNGGTERPARRRQNDTDGQGVSPAGAVPDSAILVELSSDAIVTLCGDRLVSVNQAFVNQAGYSREEALTSLSMPDLVPDYPQRKVGLQNGFPVADHDLPATFRAELVAKNGRRMPCEISAIVIEHRGKPADLVILRNVTERILSENVVRDSEEKFRTVAEQSPNMIFVNYRGRVVFVNDRCQELMGYSREEFYAEDFDFLQLITEEDRPQIMENFSRHSRGDEVEPYEYGVVTKSGRRLEVVISTKLVPYGEGRAILGIVTDVSALKRAQQELEAKNIALKEVLAQIETEKHQIRREVRGKIEKRLFPIVSRLRREAGSQAGRHIDLLESNLRDLTGELGGEVAHGMMAMTPTEVQVCNLIRSGMASKEMAAFLHISVRTVETHRNRIRKKLGIARRGVNLATYLQTL
jgi:PAS domain S-box-containing protein